MTNKIQPLVIGYEVLSKDLIPTHRYKNLISRIIELYPKNMEVIDCRIKLCNCDRTTLLITSVVKYDSEAITSRRLESYISELKEGISKIVEELLNELAIPYAEM